MRKNEAEAHPEPVGPAVSVGDVAAEVGWVDTALTERAIAAGMPLVRDWRGAPALRIEHAAELVAGVRSDYDEHSARWRDYQNYLSSRKQKAADERQEAISAARDQAVVAAKKHRQAFDEELAKRHEQEAAQKAAERSAKEGQPMPWEAFAG